jgi:hypothetical protein
MPVTKLTWYATLGEFKVKKSHAETGVMPQFG